MNSPQAVVIVLTKCLALLSPESLMSSSLSSVPAGSHPWQSASPFFLHFVGTGSVPPFAWMSLHESQVHAGGGGGGGGGGGAQKPYSSHESSLQSASSLQLPPVGQGAQFGPPQSTSVSSPLCTPSPQLATTQMLPEQTWLLQSDASTQAAPGSHASQK
ncbi:MAG: hypothetical protein QM820_65070 [Minicystis sp.]